jgi:predicted transcriptional regulator
LSHSQEQADRGTNISMFNFSGFLGIDSIFIVSLPQHEDAGVQHEDDDAQQAELSIISFFSIFSSIFINLL